MLGWVNSLKMLEILIMWLLLEVFRCGRNVLVLFIMF